MPPRTDHTADGADLPLDDLSRRLRRGRLRAPVAVLLAVVGALAFLAWSWGPIQVAEIERDGGFTFQDGDLLFVSCGGRLCRVIEDVTDSPFSHVGMIRGSGAEAQVIEAFGPVGEVPLQEFLARSDGEFTLMRWVGEPAERVGDIQQAIRAMYGRPYDARYRWDDEAIYCSELIYKGLEAATGIRAAPLRKLGELNVEPHREFIVGLEGSLPLDRRMITPADLQRSPYLRLVHTTMGLDR